MGHCQDFAKMNRGVFFFCEPSSPADRRWLVYDSGEPGVSLFARFPNYYYPRYQTGDGATERADKNSVGSR